MKLRNTIHNSVLVDFEPSISKEVAERMVEEFMEAYSRPPFYFVPVQVDLDMEGAFVLDSVSCPLCEVEPPQAINYQPFSLQANSVVVNLALLDEDYDEDYDEDQP